MDEMRILVTFVGAYDIPAEPGRAAASGCSVEYYFWGSEGEMFRSQFIENGVGGVRRSKANMDHNLVNQFQKVPGVYDGTFSMKIGSDGKPTLKLDSVKFVGALKNLEIAEPMKADSFIGVKEDDKEEVDFK